MKRSYGMLVLGSALLALAIVILVRTPRPPARRDVAPAPAGTAVTIALTMEGGTLRPARVAAPKGANVTALVANRDSAPRTIALLGYEDRVRPTRVEPGDTVRLQFEAALPGEDFAWLVDGRPAGTFAARGSHLVEGHR